MPRKHRFEKDKEPFIVCIDDLYGGFELVDWFKTEDEATEEYLSWGEKYPDEKGRNQHIFKMIRTTGHDLDDQDSIEMEAEK